MLTLDQTQRRHAGRIHGAAGRHLRTFALDRRARLGAAALSSPAAAEAGAGAGGARGRARGAARTDPRPPRARRQGDGQQTLTAESTNEQGKAGLTDCTPEEFARIQQLNADYNARFGFPFILAVRGPRGTG
jgi:hypothetical protein